MMNLVKGTAVDYSFQPGWMYSKSCGKELPESESSRGWKIMWVLLRSFESCTIWNVLPKRPRLLQMEVTCFLGLRVAKRATRATCSWSREQKKEPISWNRGLNLSFPHSSIRCTFEHKVSLEGQVISDCNEVMIKKMLWVNKNELILLTTGY